MTLFLGPGDVSTTTQIRFLASENLESAKIFLKKIKCPEAVSKVSVT